MSCWPCRRSDSGERKRPTLEEAKDFGSTTESDLTTITPSKPKGEDAVPTTTVSPEVDEVNLFELGWIAAVEKASELLERGEWEPVLIAAYVSDEVHNRVDSHRHVYWNETVSDDGQSLWAATLFAMANPGHEDGITAYRDNSYKPFVEANATKLFDGKPSEERNLWKLRGATGTRDVDNYQVSEKGKLKTYSKIEPDGRLAILYAGQVVATPAVFEHETSHRSLLELILHAFLLFMNWPDLAVFEGIVCSPRQKVKADSFGGPFASHYIQICRNLDDDQSTFRVEKFLSIGTALSGVATDTIKKVVDVFRERKVTTIHGESLDANFDPKKAIKDMDESQREALKDALDNGHADAPAAVEDVLTFKVKNTALFPPGTLRDNSGDLSVDLYKTLQAVDMYKDEHFRGESKTMIETEASSTRKRPFSGIWAA